MQTFGKTVVMLEKWKKSMLQSRCPEHIFIIMYSFIHEYSVVKIMTNIVKPRPFVSGH